MAAKSYRVIEQSFINGGIFGPGEPNGDIVEYDGEPGPNLELIKPSKAKAEPAEGDQLA